MYELIILALLSRGPLHGYLIAKITNEIIGPIAKVSNGTLYPLLGKLEQSGLVTRQTITEQEPGERRSHAFMISETGLDRLRQLLLDTTMNPGEYQKLFRFKAPYLDFLSQQDQQAVVDHYIHYCQTHILHLQAEAGDLTHDNALLHFMKPFQLSVTISLMNHIAHQWQTEIAWVSALREQLRSSRSRE
jgi:DNA-binding PadR family transcriptional regulator